jgi:hypothetical protein
MVTTNAGWVCVNRKLRYAVFTFAYPATGLAIQYRRESAPVDKDEYLITSLYVFANSIQQLF